MAVAHRIYPGMNELSSAFSSQRAPNKDTCARGGLSQLSLFPQPSSVQVLLIVIPLLLVMWFFWRALWQAVDRAVHHVLPRHHSEYSKAKRQKIREEKARYRAGRTYNDYF